MNKFKVGDNVKIREDLIYDHYYGNVRCGTVKLELRGKIGKITKIAKTGSYFVHNHWFSEEMLEACDSKNTSKFKIGDIIRCIKYKDEVVNESLRKAEIIDDTPYFKIKILEHDDPMRVNYRVECIFANLNFDDYFEYFDEEKETDLTGLHLMTPKELQEVLETFEYIDDYMDTSNRPVVDLSDHAVDSLYPNITIDVKTCDKNLFNNCMEQTDFYKYIEGIYGNKEEKDMNKVVDLWYSRKKENIYKKYKDLEDKYVKEHYEIVKQYNKLIEDFEKNLEDFCTEYSDITVNDDFVICKNADCNVYKYVIDKSVIRNDAGITYKEDKNKEYKELQLKYEDINALLSMSDDLEYQQSILIEYGIIDKKTKRICELS